MGTSVGNESPNAENQLEEESEAETQNKKSCNRDINAHEKRVFIRKCCKHKEDYKAGAKTAFWTMI